MKDEFKKKTTMNLLTELVYQIEAFKHPELVDSSELFVCDICDELGSRHNMQFYGDGEKCWEWFLSLESPLSKEAIRRLARLESLKDGKSNFDQVFSEILAERQHRLESDG